MHVGMRVPAHAFMRACVSEFVFGCVCAHGCTRTLPCDIRLICQWCRSSSMINSPACWKQCYSALATCGTPRSCTCVSASACETAWMSVPTRRSRCVDVVRLCARVSRQLCVVCNLACNPAWLCQSCQSWQTSRKTKERQSFAPLRSPLTSGGCRGWEREDTSCAGDQWRVARYVSAEVGRPVGCVRGRVWHYADGTHKYTVYSQQPNKFALNCTVRTSDECTKGNRLVKMS